MDTQKLYYVERGHGQAVVFVHGTLGDFRIWQSQMDWFAQKYHVVSYSRRCAYPNLWTDHNDEEKDYGSIQNNADDLAESIIKRLNLAPAHLVGHSYGAFTALYLAFKHPELVRTLVLGEPPVTPLAETDPQYAREIGSFIEIAAKPTIEAIRCGQTDKAVRLFVDAVMNKIGFFDQLPLQARTLMMDNAKSLEAELGSPFPHFTCEDAQRIKIPTLLVTGEQSPRLIHRIIDILATCIPNNEKITIAEVSHDLGLFSDPKVVNVKMMEFIARNS